MNTRRAAINSGGRVRMAGWILIGLVAVLLSGCGMMDSLERYMDRPRPNGGITVGVGVDVMAVVDAVSRGPRALDLAFDGELVLTGDAPGLRESRLYTGGFIVDREWRTPPGMEMPPFLKWDLPHGAVAVEGKGSEPTPDGEGQVSKAVRDEGPAGGRLSHDPGGRIDGGPALLEVTPDQQARKGRGKRQNPGSLSPFSCALMHGSSTPFRRG
jgi:hypothetical protein